MAEVEVIEKGAELAAWLGDPANDGRVVQTKLKASDRVIARVTDGIYRQPASALRELISNAWDADAQSVTILTDAPRFSRIYVRDDGVGMSDRTLARLLKNIGGSAKRRDEGQALGIVSEDDPDLTPGGRKIIGKIGIGLFSVSQLARRFEIITKVAGSGFRLVAEVRLNQYSEDAEDAEDDEEFVAGEVFIRREPTADIEAHGTDIILDDIKPRVRDILRSADRWQAIEERDAALQAGDIDTYVNLRVERPVFHSGYTGQNPSPEGEATVLVEDSKLPWLTEDPSDIRMMKLVSAVEGETSRMERPELANTLDTYLEMIWTLGLSAPVPYVQCHPFELTGKSNIAFYWLTPERGRGQELLLNDEMTVREAVTAQVKGSPKLQEGIDPVGSFNVNIDGLDLRRPIRFDHRQSESRGLEHAVMFVGEFDPDLKAIAAQQRGGELSLEGYLFWTGRIVPKENNGVLVRIRGASGALFDPTFFKYQVSEQTRLRQITSEIFVQEGLDAALNIDRESFNYAHPHVQLVTLWLHGALRQLTNRLKDLASKKKQERSEATKTQVGSALTAQAEQVWKRRQGDAPAPDVQFTDDPDEAANLREQGSLVFNRALVDKNAALQKDVPRDIQTAALIQILTAYGMLEGRPYAEQQEIIRSILEVFYAGAQ